MGFFRDFKEEPVDDVTLNTAQTEDDEMINTL